MGTKQKRIAVTKTITLKPEIIELGEAIAKEDIRSFSNLIEKLILDEAKRNGLKTETEQKKKLPQLPFKN